MFSMSVSTSVNVLDVKHDLFSAFRFKAGPVIGSGMSGQVVLATHMDRPELKMAVKMFITSTEDGGMKSKKLFAREARAMKNLDHPNLMKMLAAVRCPNYLAITMPYYQKASLSTRLTELTPSHLALYFTQLTCALNYLYNKRIVHSDIKPSNILVDDRDNAILGDFGVAFTVAPDEEVVTADRVGGTLAFMAPELFNSKCVEPFKLDIFSLGAVVWCILFRVEPKSTVIFDYLHETNTSPHVPDPYRWALPAMLDPVAKNRISVTQLLARLKDARFCLTIIDTLDGLDNQRISGDKSRTNISVTAVTSRINIKDTAVNSRTYITAIAVTTSSHASISFNKMTTVDKVSVMAWLQVLIDLIIMHLAMPKKMNQSFNDSV